MWLEKCLAAESEIATGARFFGALNGQPVQIACLTRSSRFYDFSKRSFL